MAGYDFTPELKAKILAAIKNKKDVIRCSVCQHWDWDMADGFATIPLLSNVWTNDRKSGLPCAALVCKNCGNTLFINLVALGFAESLGPDIKKIMDEARGRTRG